MSSSTMSRLIDVTIFDVTKRDKKVGGLFLNIFEREKKIDVFNF